MPIFSGSADAARAISSATGEVVTRWQYDEPTGLTVIERVQDVEPIFEVNKQLYNDGDGYSPSRELRRVASIPMAIVEMWMQEGVNIFNPDHMPEIRRRLNDSENLFMRTAPGRL